MNERKRRQLELAKMFYEMGMEEELVSKISGIELHELKEQLLVDNSHSDKYNNRANEK